MTTPDINLEHEETRRKLIALRSKLGADTPAGHRCSNLVEQLQEYKRSSDETQRGHLIRGIKAQMTELTELAAKADKPQ